MLKHALVILDLFGVDLNVYLHPNVAVLSMDTTFLLERLSGQMMLVSGFVIAPWREDIWNAKTKAVGNGEHCQVKNGIRDCYPVSQRTCMALGDPHYYTFDGKYFDFQVLDALKNCAIFLHNMFHAVYNNTKWRGKKS